MNLYLITNDEADYDEYKGWVIAAKDRRSAEKLLDRNLHSEHKVKKIGVTHYKKEGVILSDFNAG